MAVFHLSSPIPANQTVRSPERIISTETVFFTYILNCPIEYGAPSYLGINPLSVQRDERPSQQDHLGGN